MNECIITWQWHRAEIDLQSVPAPTVDQFWTSENTMLATRHLELCNNITSTTRYTAWFTVRRFQQHVYNWRNSDVITAELTDSWYTQINPYKMYISDFAYLKKINRMMPLCNLFMGDPPHLPYIQLLWMQQLSCTTNSIRMEYRHNNSLMTKCNVLEMHYQKYYATA